MILLARVRLVDCLSDVGYNVPSILVDDMQIAQKRLSFCPPRPATARLFLKRLDGCRADAIITRVNELGEAKRTVYDESTGASPLG